MVAVFIGNVGAIVVGLRVGVAVVTVDVVGMADGSVDGLEEVEMMVGDVEGTALGIIDGPCDAETVGMVDGRPEGLLL